MEWIWPNKKNNGNRLFVRLFKMLWLLSRVSSTCRKKRPLWRPQQAKRKVLNKKYKYYLYFAPSIYYFAPKCCPAQSAKRLKKGCFKPVAQVLILREGIISHVFAFDAPKNFFQTASVFDASFDCPPAMLYAERAGDANDLCQREP